MGYLSCRAESSVSTCRSISDVTPPQKKPPINPQKEDLNNKRVPTNIIQQFPYAEIESATNNFADSSLLGRGSHGSVYKATINFKNAPLVVAVKRASSRKLISPLSRNEVENEIQILSDVASPRIVNIIGYTSRSCSHRLLVMEYMPNGTLYDFLHHNPKPPNWPRRLRLALQTAKALSTLHSLSPPVIHRDVKSANVLIDHNFNARLGDFGLAIRLSSCRSTPPAGTLGYLDPCYVTPDDLSMKTDVFSFGILLLEMISGRKAIDVQNSPPSVVEWAVPLLRKGKVSSIYDPRVPPPRNMFVRRQLGLLVASCVRSSDERRPSMMEVVEKLKFLSMLLDSTRKGWNGLTVGNPCSMVDVGGKPLKLKPDKNSRYDDDEVLARDMHVTRKKPPLSVSRDKFVKVVKLINDENKALFDEGTKESKNLMDFLAHKESGRSLVNNGPRLMGISISECNVKR